jgi:hypothetical protein
MWGLFSLCFQRARRTVYCRIKMAMHHDPVWKMAAAVGLALVLVVAMLALGRP